jgi:hypothetical protein
MITAWTVRMHDNVLQVELDSSRFDESETASSAQDPFEGLDPRSGGTEGRHAERRLTKDKHVGGPNPNWIRIAC